MENIKFFHNAIGNTIFKLFKKHIHTLEIHTVYWESFAKKMFADFANLGAFTTIFLALIDVVMKNFKQKH